MLRHFK